MTGHPPSQPNIESLPERLRVNSCRLAHETADRAATRRIETEFAAADTIERLTERCEQYKGQVKAGSDEIDALKTLLRRSQQILAMLIDPESIKSTTVMHAWAQATELEAKIRSALSPDGNRGVGNV